MINVKCPKCDQYMSVFESDAGRSEPCPNCGNVNVIPHVGGQASDQRVPPVSAAGPSNAEEEAKMWGMWTHLGGLATFLGLPLGGVIAPLISWLVKKDQFPLVDYHGKEALNFQVSIAIYLVVAAASLLAFIGILLVPAVLIFDIIQIVIASIKATKGEVHRYPLTIRFVT